MGGLILDFEFLIVRGHFFFIRIIKFFYEINSEINFKKKETLIFDSDNY